MATEFENFIQNELPLRAVIFTFETTGYNGDPNNIAAPDILKYAPKGTLFIRDSDKSWYVKTGTAADSWELVAAATVASEGSIITTVSTTGSDTPTLNRPALLTVGDYSAYPFLTIQAAINSLPKQIKHDLHVHIDAGNFTGFEVSGFTGNPVGSTIAGLAITGAIGLVTPTTGPASGTASSGSTSSLTLIGAGWTIDDFKGKFVRIVAGAGAGQRTIVATNTATVLTFAHKFTSSINATSQFEIYEPKTIINTAIGSYTCKVVHNAAYIQLEKLNVTSYHTIAHFLAACLQIIRFIEIMSTDASTPILCQSTNMISCSLLSLKNSLNGGVTTQASNHCFIGGLYAENCVSPIYTDSMNSINIAGIWIKSIDVYPSIELLNTRSPFVANSTVYGLTNVVIDGGVVGIKISNCDISLVNATIKNQTTEAFSLYNSKLLISGSLIGTGNGGWGMRANKPGVSVTLTVTPTITGTLGNATIDNSVALTWATQLNTSNQYATNVASGSRIYRE